MKNKKFQSLVASSKAYFKRKGNQFHDKENRISIYHQIEDRPFWWGDFATYCGSQRLMIWAVHLRMDYKDKCDSLAFSTVDRTDREGCTLPEFEPIKKKVGNSRKKTILWQMNSETCESRKGYYDRLHAEEERIAAESDIIAVPRFSVQQLPWCRGMDIVTAEELNTEDKIVDFINRCRELATYRTPFSELFDTGVVYDRDTWNAEAPLREVKREPYMKAINSHVLAHREEN